MKRFLLSLLGTVGGLVALLSFKTQSPVAGAGALPEQSLTTGSSPSVPAATPPSTATAPASSSSSAAPTPRSWLGSAVTTRYGVVQVKVTVSGSKITDVAFAQLTAFDGHSQEINAQAGPILLDETLQAQGAQIDSVSGATYTSDGYVQSLQSALDAAGIR